MLPEFPAAYLPEVAIRTPHIIYQFFTSAQQLKLSSLVSYESNRTLFLTPVDRPRSFQEKRPGLALGSVQCAVPVYTRDQLLSPSRSDL